MRAATRYTAVGVAALALAGLLAVVLQQPRVPPTAPVSATTPSRSAAHRVEPLSPVAPVPSEPTSVSSAAPLTAAEVIGNSHCRLYAGEHQARDLAVVVLPDEGAAGARFAVIDGGGRVFDGRLPFVPTRASLGKSADTGVLAGFGRWGGDHQPVRLFHNGHLVYEREFAWDFGVAADGSSHYVVAGVPHAEFSDLVLRNWHLGIETHMDIGEAHHGHLRALFPGLRVDYAHDHAEIILAPSSLGGPAPGEYRFVPVDGGEPRTITVQESGMVFASSRFGYVYREGGGDALPQVVKRRFAWRTSTEFSVVDEWSTPLDAGVPFGGIMLSDDQRWLMVPGLPLAILEAASGAVVFAFPTPAELARAVRGTPAQMLSEQELRRAFRHSGSRPSAGSAPDVADSVALLQAAIGGADQLFRSLLTTRLGDVLQSGERIGSLDEIAIRDGRFEVWLRIEDGPMVAALFDIDTIGPEASPRFFRVDVEPNNACIPATAWRAGWRVRDGELTYHRPAVP